MFLPQEKLRNKHITKPASWFDAFESLSLKFGLWKIIENDCKVASKSYCCLSGTRTFPGSHFSKNYGNGYAADNFVSPYTVDFKMQTSHTVRLEITATLQAGIFLTATLHKKMRNTATPQIPNAPLLYALDQRDCYIYERYV